MKIKEVHINAVIDLIDQEDFDLEGALKNISGVIPNILAYSMSESFALLTVDERDYFEYLGLTILITALNNLNEIKDLEADEIGEIDERMWGLLEEQKSKEFNKKVDVFFQKTKDSKRLYH